MDRRADAIIRIGTVDGIPKDCRSRYLAISDSANSFAPVGRILGCNEG